MLLKQANCYGIINNLGNLGSIILKYDIAISTAINLLNVLIIINIMVESSKLYILGEQVKLLLF